MINLSEVINDTDFAQSFVIARDTGNWVLGKWVSSESNVTLYGIIQPATAEELDEVPEADRVRGVISVHSSQPIYETNPNGISDLVSWNNQTYKIVKLYPWNDFGYFKGLAVRMSGI